jgi:hypothetical protein
LRAIWRNDSNIRSAQILIVKSDKAFHN